MNSVPDTILSTRYVIVEFVICTLINIAMPQNGNKKRRFLKYDKILQQESLPIFIIFKYKHTIISTTYK